MRDWQNFFTEEDFGLTSKYLEGRAIVALANKAIREALEAAPKVYGHIGSEASSWSTYPPGTFIQENNTHTARLVDVKPIEKGESGD